MSARSEYVEALVQECIAKGLGRLEGVERADAIVDLYTEHSLLSGPIATIFSISRSRVYQILKSRGISRANRMRSREAVLKANAKKIRILVDGGWTQQDVADEFNVTAWDVAKIVGGSHRYSDKMKQRARALYKRIKNTYVVGMELGVSDETVRNWCSDIIIPNDQRHYDDTIRKRALAMLARKQSCREVAREIGCSVGTVRNWKNAANGIPRKRKPWSGNAAFQKGVRQETRDERRKLKIERMQEAAEKVGRQDLVEEAPKLCPKWEKCKR